MTTCPKLDKDEQIFFRFCTRHVISALLIGVSGGVAGRDLTFDSESRRHSLLRSVLMRSVFRRSNRFTVRRSSAWKYSVRLWKEPSQNVLAFSGKQDCITAACFTYYNILLQILLVVLGVIIIRYVTLYLLQSKYPNLCLGHHVSVYNLKA